MWNRRLLLGVLVALASGSALSESAVAGPCASLRREWDYRSRAMEDAFRDWRRELRDEHRDRLDHYHADLRDASRLCPEERVVVQRAIHAEIRATHRWFAESNRALERRIRAEREAFRRAREHAYHVCDSGRCPFCRHGRRG